MELIVIPPKISVGFRVSLTHDLLTLARLLPTADSVEGLSNWTQQAANRLSSEGRAVLNQLSMCMLFAAGLQGFLVEQIPEDDDTNFEAIWQRLNNLSPLQIQQAAQQALTEYLVKVEIMGKNMALPQSPSLLSALIDQAQRHRELNWQNPTPLTLSSDAFAALLLDGAVLKDAVLQGLWYLWHNIYHTQAADSLAQAVAAVNYHQAQNYNNDLSIVFRAVTGRNLPDYLKSQLAQIRQVELIPSCHLGAYITVSQFGDKWWIGFNANLVDASQSTLPSVADLYPALKALADETRLKIVKLLTHRELNVGEIADALNLTQSTASRHLTLLAKTDILQLRRDGTMRYYQVQPQTLIDISNRLKELYDE